MSTAGNPHELVVADDGSIPAEQVALLGVGPGTHLRVIAAEPVQGVGSIVGQLTSWPEVTWEEFERASDLARSDLDRS